MARLKKELMREIEYHELYNYYYERLINIALAQFEWHNLPDTCDRDYFERMLLFKGTAAIYNPLHMDMWITTGYIPIAQSVSKLDNKTIESYMDVDSQIMNQNATSTSTPANLFNPSTTFDIYGYPINIRGIGYTGQQIATEKWHIVYDNKSRHSLIGQIDMYSRQLAEVHATLRQNVMMVNKPYIVQTSKTNALSVKEIFKAIFRFQPVVSIKRDYDITDDIKVIPTPVDYLGDKLLEQLQGMWKEALSMLGISSQSTKKERLLDDEIQMGREGDIIALNARLANRVEFCNKMNKLYNMNISVNLSSVDVDLNGTPIDEITTNEPETGGASDE